MKNYNQYKYNQFNNIHSSPSAHKKKERNTENLVIIIIYYYYYYRIIVVDYRLLLFGHNTAIHILVPIGTRDNALIRCILYLLTDLRSEVRCKSYEWSEDVVIYWHHHVLNMKGEV